jgi:hypothetical protein
MWLTGIGHSSTGWQDDKSGVGNYGRNGQSRPYIQSIMERRKAPISFKRRTMAAFELFGAPPIATLILFFIVRPAAPSWIKALIFGASVVVGFVLFFRFRPRFKCPECGNELKFERTLDSKPGDPICYICGDCQIEWDSGMRVVSS